MTDRCVVDAAAQVCSVEELQTLQTRLSTPRQEAGGPSANDNVACRLQPLDRADFDFMLVPFTDEEWATLESSLSRRRLRLVATRPRPEPGPDLAALRRPLRRPGVRRPQPARRTRSLRDRCRQPGLGADAAQVRA